MHADAIEGSYRECRFVTDTYGQCLEAVARAVDLVSAVGDAPVESDVGRQIALDAARDDRVTRLLAVGEASLLRPVLPEEGGAAR